MESASFTTTAVAYGTSSSAAAAAAKFSAVAGEPKCLCRVMMTGPEPGYVATPLLSLAMVTSILKDGALLQHQSGCVMPSALIGPGDALDSFVRRLADAGIAVSVL